MKVPKDPNLYLTVFTGISVTVVMAFWLLTPVYTPHLEEAEHAASVKPEQALGQVDAVLTAAEKTLAEMDVEKGGEKVESTNETTQALPAEKGSKPMKVVPASVPDAHAKHDMAGQDHEPEPEPEESLHSHEAGGDHGH